MTLLGMIASILVLLAVIYIGFKIIKNIIVIIILVIALVVVLYYFGYLLPF